MDPEPAGPAPDGDEDDEADEDDVIGRATDPELDALRTALGEDGTVSIEQFHRLTAPAALRRARVVGAPDGGGAAPASELLRRAASMSDCQNKFENSPSPRDETHEP